MEMATRLIEPGPFPRTTTADAIHVAAATAYGCDYLLTWNFKHINTAQIKRATMRVIEAYGYEPTIICTPDEFVGSHEAPQG
jgi:hypothetical protein